MSSLALAPLCALVLLGAPGAPANAAARETDASAWTYNPWANIKGGALQLFDEHNRWTLAGGAAAWLGARTLDEEANDYFAHKNRLGGVERLGNDFLGTGVPGVLLGAGFWLYGDLTGHAYESHAGQAQIESLFVTAILTSTMKAAVNRQRPDSADRYSFPSGHTSTVFASAAALQEFYGWKAGVPAYLLGTLTATSRMSEQKHWLSDTVGGALVGMLVGHAYASYHLGRERLESKDDGIASRVSFFPLIESEGGRLIVQARF